MWDLWEQSLPHNKRSVSALLLHVRNSILRPLESEPWARAPGPMSYWLRALGQVDHASIFPHLQGSTNAGIDLMGWRKADHEESLIDSQWVLLLLFYGALNLSKQL